MSLLTIHVFLKCAMDRHGYLTHSSVNPDRLYSLQSQTLKTAEMTDFHYNCMRFPEHNGHLMTCLDFPSDMAFITSVSFFVAVSLFISSITSLSLPFSSAIKILCGELLLSIHSFGSTEGKLVVGLVTDLAIYLNCTSGNLTTTALGL